MIRKNEDYEYACSVLVHELGHYLIIKNMPSEKLELLLSLYRKYSSKCYHDCIKQNEIDACIVGFTSVPKKLAPNRKCFVRHIRDMLSSLEMTPHQIETSVKQIMDSIKKKIKEKQKPKIIKRTFELPPEQGAAALLAGSKAEELPLLKMSRKRNKIIAVYGYKK
jgi:arginine decarboxylase-like protein